MSFLALRHFLLFWPRVFYRALGSVARRKSAGTPGCKCGPWPTSVAHALEVQESHVPTGRHSEHVGPSKPLLTHVHVKRMSDGSCDIGDLECHQSMSSDITYLVMEKFSPTPTCQTCDHF